VFVTAKENLHDGAAKTVVVFSHFPVFYTDAALARRPNPEGIVSWPISPPHWSRTCVKKPAPA
jgi:hypothetical protein